MNPSFRYLVEQARGEGRRVIDRCNLTILFEPGQEDLPEFLSAMQVEIIASLPCYSEENVTKQRGQGVYDKSIQALLRLNAAGYGRTGSGLTLNLIYNPVGAHLPPPQEQLEAELNASWEHGLGSRLISCTPLRDMPIARFAHSLERERTNSTPICTPRLGF